MRIQIACLLLLIGCTGCAQTCMASFDYAQRPSGYDWRPSTPKGGNRVYYGIDPATGWTVYVGPDGRYYTFRHRGIIEPSDLHSTWCPHGVGKLPATRSALSSLFASLGAIFSHTDRLTTYDYLNRPVGYDWKARRSQATGAVGYYGVDPTNGWTVYVGPDNQYYTFPHRGDIEPSDLMSTWHPHNVREPRR